MKTINCLKYFAVLILIISSCKKDSLEVEHGIIREFTSTSKDALLADLQTSFINNNHGGRKPSQDIFDHANWDNVYKIQHLEIDLTKYTVPIKPRKYGQFENLIFVNQGDERHSAIIRYTPDDEWLKSGFLEEGMLHFTGNIALLDADGEVIADSDYKGGEWIEPNETEETGRANGEYCTSVFKVETWQNCTSEGCVIVDVSVTELTTCVDTGGGGADYYPSELVGENGGESKKNIAVIPIDGSDLADMWELEKIDDSKLKPCMKTIITDLKGLNKGVGQIVSKFAGTFPGYNWETVDGSLSGGTASTNPRYNHTTGTVTTTFDSQSWRQATELSWARTMLHESVHAYLVAWDKNTNLSTKVKTYPQLMSDYFNGVNANQAQHDEMARSFVSDIADALQEYGANKGYNFARQFYEDMSWAGLQGTSYFSKLSSSDQSRILKTSSIELTGKDLQGNVQTQKGTNAGC